MGNTYQKTLGRTVDMDLWSAMTAEVTFYSWSPLAGGDTIDRWTIDPDLGTLTRLEDDWTTLDAQGDATLYSNAARFLYDTNGTYHSVCASSTTFRVHDSAGNTVFTQTGAQDGGAWEGGPIIIGANVVWQCVDTTSWVRNYYRALDGTGGINYTEINSTGHATGAFGLSPDPASERVLGFCGYYNSGGPSLDFAKITATGAISSTKDQTSFNQFNQQHRGSPDGYFYNYLAGASTIYAFDSGLNRAASKDFTKNAAMTYNGSMAIHNNVIASNTRTWNRSATELDIDAAVGTSWTWNLE